MRILVIRFSALGDVSLCLPVLTQFKAQFPEHELFFLSKPVLQDLFADKPIRFIAADVKNQYKGLQGLYQLGKELISEVKPDLVIDLHNVIRSKILLKIFHFNGIKTYSLNKARKDRKRLSRLKNKVRIPLPHITQRYAEVFQNAGFDLNFDPEQAVRPRKSERSETVKIGFAPFAKHRGKIWGLDKSKQLASELQKIGYEIFLFGGKEDSEELEEIAGSIINITNCSKLPSLKDELELIATMDLMISMDSFNMHLAALCGVKTLSIWGATHSYAGFGPIGGNEEYKVEVPLEELGCRPCSIYGNKPCYRGDYACMEQISVAMVLSEIDRSLANSSLL